MEIVHSDGSLTRLCYKLGNNIPQVIPLSVTITCNQAEYLALIVAILEIKRRGVQSVAFFSDSQLMVNQVNGKIKTRDATLYFFRTVAHQMLDKIPDWTLTWIPRERNEAGRVLDGEVEAFEEDSKWSDAISRILTGGLALRESSL